MSHQSNGVSNGHIVVETHHQFLDELYKMMVRDAYDGMKDRDSKVVEFKHPKELEAMLDLGLNKETSDDSLLKICQDIIKYSVKTGHPRFFNQLYGGLDDYSLGGSWLTEVLNTSVYTFEVSPVFTVMEKTLLQKMLDLIGFTDGDAIFTPGGSLANMYALNVARYKRFPDVKKTGVYGLPKLCVLTSEKGHYSMKKGMAFLGIGLDNLVNVKADDKGKMDVQDLENKILQVQSEGKMPYLVNATAGTTVFGVYDPLDKIADICQKYGLWMHVDGAWGGSALLSKTYRGLLKGIDRADSMTWNPHKMMGAPLQSAAFLTRHKKLLPECHSANAAYLFQQDKFYDVSYDTGDKSIQCGRKNDCLKLWMMWKAKGDVGFEKDIDNLFECSRYLAKSVKNKEGFELVVEPECTNVCFWYIPVSMRNQPRDADWWQRLGKVAPKIKEKMTKDGTMLIGYQPDGERVNFFRMIISNLEIVKADMDFVISEIDRLGKDL
uniref:Cysteine sulfinic acid decarboxylase-like n=2 Tax=Crassostrea virginica TaxID=6565 RepID=A0A8B8DN20_CRAVI|nr:cysteine sulfinic acid decarboxylase-like [Crassostrea virginica]XP_022334582.1 cysteine sulfinic acid decarboxylase-like isoform X1 [Crassostrea virginica]